MYIGSTGSRGLHHLVCSFLLCAFLLVIVAIERKSVLVLLNLLLFCLQVYEILDNAIDEAQAGFASKIDVILLADNSVCITDNGRGVCDRFYAD